MLNKTRFLKRFSLLLTITATFILSSCCSDAGYNREQYFQVASKQHYQLQQSPPTKTDPAQYTVCGSRDFPCEESTKLNEHKAQCACHKKVHHKKHHAHQGRKTECPLK